MTLPQYVGKIYTRATFAERLAKCTWTKGWRPKYIVQHATGSPTIAQVRNDPNAHLTRMLNMELDYENRLHWTHTPHLFIFPDPNGPDGLIGEMNDLEVRGTHSSCDNMHALGVECVGYYSPGHDDWNAGDGAKVRNLARWTFAQLYKALGLHPDPFVLHQTGHHFHSMCTADGHSICPGPELNRDNEAKEIAALMAA